MTTNASFARVAALLGDPARAAMLHGLMDGRALTATELAHIAGVTQQTTSGHLAQLSAAGLLAVEKQGRHRYHRLATPQVARLLETIMQVAAETSRPPARRTVTGPRDAAMRAARTCYDHVAGRLGVAIADAMIARALVELSEDGGIVTERGTQFLDGLGIALDDASLRGRAVCRPCLDWSERRPHLAGRLGAALCDHAQEAGWVRRRADSRALDITPKGRRAFREQFGIDAA